MTYERIAIEALARCSFLPGSWDKRFARDMAATAEDYRLTAKQRQCLWKMAWKYRRQMPPLATTEARRWLDRDTREAEFQAALDDDPMDFTVRLVFSDWLEECGRDSEAVAQRWMAANEVAPYLTPVGQSYGPGGVKGCNHEWTFGMKVWEKCGKTLMNADYLPYHHNSREQAEARLAVALEEQRVAEQEARR